MPNLRRFQPTFALLRAAYVRLGLHHTPSTRSLERIKWYSVHRTGRERADEIRAAWRRAIAEEIAATEDKISTLTGRVEHLVAHLGYKPERREEFAEAAESLMTVLVSELRKIAPRTNADCPLPE